MRDHEIPGWSAEVVEKADSQNGKRSASQRFRHYARGWRRAGDRSGWIEMTIPGKPTSRIQRYRTTAAGREVLAAAEGGGEMGRYPTAGTIDEREVRMVRSPAERVSDE